MTLPTLADSDTGSRKSHSRFPLSVESYRKRTVNAEEETTVRNNTGVENGSQAVWSCGGGDREGIDSWAELQILFLFFKKFFIPRLVLYERASGPIEQTHGR